MATAAFTARDKDALFLGLLGSDKSEIAQATGDTLIGHGHQVICRETRAQLEGIAQASIDEKRKEHMEMLPSARPLISDDSGTRNGTNKGRRAPGARDVPS